MRRVVVLGVLVAVGALSMGLVALQQGGEQEIGVTQVRDNLYLLSGGGGNTAAFVTSDAVVVVDAKNPGWGQPILDKIRELTPKPVTMLINTHTHGDHVGGNKEFPATVEVIVQENTQANMQRMDVPSDRAFADRMTIGSGADAVELYYFGPGHTNGDAFVVFPALRTVHAGDIFARKAVPLVDPNNGGSVLHYAESIAKAYAGIANVDTIIAGHDPQPLEWSELAMYVEFNQDFLAWAQAQLQAGKTPEQAAEEWTLPERYAAAGYSANVSDLFGGLAGRIQRLAEEMREGGSLAER